MRRTPLAGVVLAVLIGACGGGSDKSPQTTSSTQTTAATLTARLETSTPTATVAATATTPATTSPTTAATATPAPTATATVAPATTAPTPTPTPTPTRAPTPAPTPPPTTAPAQAQSVDVKAGEWYFEPAQIAVQAGTVTFNLVNNGPDRPHTFGIRNPSGGSDLVRSGQVPVGRSVTIQTDLQSGTYEFYCSLPGHADRGQRGTLTVR